MSTISACVVCRNEATKLAACLESLTWVDEILVLDLESEDGSAAIARSFGATVVERAPHPIVEPLRNEIADRAASTWILALDPDERVRPALARELRRLAGRDDIDAVIVPRMNIDFGWVPTAPQQRYEPQLRMYRTAAVRWPEFPNKLPVVPEDRVARVEGIDPQVLEHHRNIEVAETAERLVRYAPAQADAMYDRGDRFSADAMIRELLRVGGKHLVHSRPWDDGVPGMMRAIVLFNHHVYVWIAFWQRCGAERTHDDDAHVRRLGRMVEPYLFLRRLRLRLRRAFENRVR